MEKTPKVTFYLPEKEWADLKIMCVLTHKTMTDFIRVAVKEKIKTLKDQAASDLPPQE